MSSGHIVCKQEEANEAKRGELRREPARLRGNPEDSSLYFLELKKREKARGRRLGEPHVRGEGEGKEKRRKRDFLKGKLGQAPHSAEGKRGGKEREI